MKFLKITSLVFILLFLFFIPFGMVWSNVFWYLSILGLFLNKNFYKNFSLKRISNSQKLLILFSFGYILWCGISLLWTENLNRGLELVGRYVPILLLPMFFFLAKVSGIIKKMELLICVFILGTLVSSVVCVYLSYKNCWFDTIDGKVFSFDQENRAISLGDTFLLGTNNFTYRNLSHFIHPSYFSLYFLFGIIFLVDMLFKVKKKLKFTIILLLFYSLLFILFLESRACLITLFIVIIITICYYLLRRGYFKVLLLSIILLSFVFVEIIPKTRLSGVIIGVEKALKRFDKQEHIVESNNTECMRILIWKNTFRAIKGRFIFGTGVGDTDVVLYDKMKEDNLDFDYGTHNQYLYAQLSMGIVSLLLLLAMLFIPLYYGIKNRYFPLIGFSLAVIINLLFENMLTRTAGLMFIPWAMAVLLMMSENKKVLEK